MIVLKFPELPLLVRFMVQVYHRIPLMILYLIHMILKVKSATYWIKWVLMVLFKVKIWIYGPGSRETSASPLE